MSEHSPLPWRCIFDREGGVDFIHDATDRSVVTTDSGFYIKTPGDMEFIVEAVNNYESLQSQLSQVQGELEKYRKLNSTLADWNDALRVTIGDYLIDRANKADLKLALHHWTTRPVNPEWTDDMMKALERAVAERDALKAENEKFKAALEEIAEGSQSEFYMADVSRKALQPREGE